MENLEIKKFYFNYPSTVIGVIQKMNDTTNEKILSNYFDNIVVGDELKLNDFCYQFRNNLIKSGLVPNSTKTVEKL